jgi:HlyD family secretion protein
MIPPLPRAQIVRRFRREFRGGRHGVHRGDVSLVNWQRGSAVKQIAAILVSAVALFAVYKKHESPSVGLLDCFRPHSERFMYAGVLEVTKVILSSRIASEIVSFKLSEGDAVKKGQTIAKLDDETYRIASKQLNNDYDRSLRLVRDGHIATEQHERIERAKKDNDLHIKWCEIRSPVDGIIMTKFKEEGEFVLPGTNILSVADTNDIWTFFYVEHDRIHRLKIGDEVKCRLSESPERIFSGTLIKINEEAEFTPKNVQTRKERTRLVYGVKVKFKNNDLTLKPGMTLETSFDGLLPDD